MTIMEEIEEFDFTNTTYRKIGDMCCKCETEEEAMRFLEKYREYSPEHADGNLGYLFGYYGEETRKRLYSLFKTCNHPIFGQKFGRGYEPTPDEAVEKGKQFGKNMHRGD